MGKIVGIDLNEGGICETMGWSPSNWMFDRLYGKFYREFAARVNDHIDGWNKAFDLFKPDWNGNWDDPSELYQKFIRERFNDTAKLVSVKHRIVKDVFVDGGLGLCFADSLFGKKYRILFQEPI